jgi:hypothetical protein
MQHIRLLIRFLKSKNAWKEYTWRTNEAGYTLKWLLHTKPQSFLMDAFDWEVELEDRNNTHNMKDQFYEDWFWEELHDEWYFIAIKNGRYDYPW